MGNLKELKKLIEREYMKSLMNDLDQTDLSPDEKVVIFADMCHQAGIDLRARLLN